MKLQRLICLSFFFVLIGHGPHSATAGAPRILVGVPENLGQPVDTAANEQGPDISADGLSLFFNRGHYGDGADIFVSTRDSTDSPWNVPQPVGPSVNTSRAEASPAISPDGQELYFDDGHRAGYPEPLRPGGMGGPDIWVSKWNAGDGSWGTPQNVSFNSEYREYSPNLSADGLELYFASDRPGSLASSGDLWVSRRTSTEGAWGEPEHLGTVNSSVHDDRPAISPDGRVLAFSSNRAGAPGSQSSLWLSFRERPEDDWSTPTPMGNLNGPYWTMDPDFSPDGTTLYYGRYDSGPGNTLWQVALSPLPTVMLDGANAEYTQNFDDTFSVSATSGETLPVGWAVTTSGFLHENVTTGEFPLSDSEFMPRSVMSIYNAGHEADVDRALAVGVPASSDAAEIHFSAGVSGTDAKSFQLQFDIEAWDTERLAVSPGEAAFDVTLEVDTGEGFTVLRDLGTITTGVTLSPSSSDNLDGNAPANRISFNSGVVTAPIPAGTDLRIRWAPNRDRATRGWVFGLDNVAFSLFETGIIASGDFNEDGLLDVIDLDQLTAAASAVEPDALFDVNQDGNVDEQDVSIWVTELKDTYFGDTNLDGQVNALDLNTLALNWRTDNASSWSQADFNADGQVNASDLNSLALNWRSGTEALAKPAAVPEPMSISLLLIGTVAIVRLTRG